MLNELSTKYYNAWFTNLTFFWRLLFFLTLMFLKKYKKDQNKVILSQLCRPCMSPQVLYKGNLKELVRQTRRYSPQGRLHSSSWYRLLLSAESSMCPLAYLIWAMIHFLLLPKNYNWKVHVTHFDSWKYLYHSKLLVTHHFRIKRGVLIVGRTC